MPKVALPLLVVLLACARPPEAAAPPTTPLAKPAAPVPPPPLRIDLVAAPAAGSVAAYVQSEQARAQAEQRKLLVYVGATWCEPCRRFHDAAKAGLVDKELGALRLLEFDLDRDRERLEGAGYTSQLIPLFALPGADGRASGKAIQGSIKGDGAVGNLVPRLLELLRLASLVLPSPPR